MPTPFEQQVIANQLALQQILNDSVDIGELTEIPGGLQDDDLIGVFRGSLESTYWIKYSDFFTSSSIQSWSPSVMGFIATLGSTTTIQEYEDHFNNIGFTISINQLKILEVVSKIGNVLYKQRFIYKQNTPGDYGNGIGETPITFSQLYLLSQEKFYYNELDTIIIDLGNIGGNTISQYIEATPTVPEWDLQGNVFYIFKANISNVENTYLYIGDQPRIIGQNESPPVTELDFENLNQQGWYFIEGSWVDKIGNTNYSALEVNDVVYYKGVTHSGIKITLVGWRYDGGDKGLKSNYTKVISIA